MNLRLVLPIQAAILLAQAPPPSFFQAPPLDVAKACVERALVAYPKKVEFLVILGDVLFSQGKVEEARAVYARAQAIKPRDPDTYIFLGRSKLLIQGDRAKAREMFHRAEECQPKSIGPLCDIAKVWVAAGAREDLGPLAERAIPLVAEDPRHAAELAPLLVEAGFPLEGIQMMAAFSKARPRERGAFIEFGSACLRARRHQDAIAWMDRAIAVDPNRLKTRREVAKAFADDTDPADRLLVKTAMFQHADIGFAEKRLKNEDLAKSAWIYLVGGEKEKAESVLRQIVESPKIDADTLSSIGWAYLQLGMDSEAFRVFEVLPGSKGSGGVIGFGGPFSGGLFFRPAAQFDISNISKKNAMAESALRLASKGHLNKALPLMREVLLLDPTDFDWLIQFGQACEKAGDREDALFFYSRAAQGRFDEEECWSALANAFLAIGRKKSPRFTTFFEKSPLGAFSHSPKGLLEISERYFLS